MVNTSELLEFTVFKHLLLITLVYLLQNICTTIKHNILVLSTKEYNKNNKGERDKMSYKVLKGPSNMEKILNIINYTEGVISVYFSGISGMSRIVIDSTSKDKYDYKIASCSSKLAEVQEKINNVVKEYPGYEIFSVSSSRLHIKTFIFLRKKK